MLVTGMQTGISIGPNPCVIPFIYIIITWEISEHQPKTSEVTYVCKDLHVYVLLLVLCLVVKLCLMLLQPHGLQPTRLHCPWDFPGKNTGLGCRFLLQGIFPIQGSSLCFLHWQVDSLLLSHQGSPQWRLGPSKVDLTIEQVRSWPGVCSGWV